MNYRLGVLAAIVLFPAYTYAHVLNYGTVSTELNIDGSDIRLQTEVSQNINVYGYEPEAQRASYQKYFENHFTVRVGSSSCPFTLTYYDPSFDSPHGLFRGTFACSRPITSLDDLSIHSDLFYDAFRSFDHFVVLTIGNDRYSLPFSAVQKDFPGNVRPEHLGTVFDYFIVVALSFLWKGMLHIWTGYDHILFLLSVILLVRSPKRLILLVTSFTLAHSLTLLLAGFHILSLSSHIVEPAIAATILFVAIRNIQTLRRAQVDATHDHGAILTFAFGLIHGLGFASVLQESAIPQIFFVPALLTFNLGIEFGQLVILTLALPLLWYIDSTVWRTRILKYFSYVVCILAAFWILARIFFF